MEAQNRSREDSRKIFMQIQTFRERLKSFEEECRRNFNEQISTLEELSRWCDYMLYCSSELSRRDAEEENSAPEDR